MRISNNRKCKSRKRKKDEKATIDEAVYPILSDVRYELSKVDEIFGTVTCYGEDVYSEPITFEVH